MTARANAAKSTEPVAEQPLPAPGSPCSWCGKPSNVKFTLEPGIGPRGQEPCHLCPRCMRD